MGLKKLYLWVETINHGWHSTKCPSRTKSTKEIELYVSTWFRMGNCESKTFEFILWISIRLVMVSLINTALYKVKRGLFVNRINNSKALKIHTHFPRKSCMPCVQLCTDFRNFFLNMAKTRKNWPRDKSICDVITSLVIVLDDWKPTVVRFQYQLGQVWHTLVWRNCFYRSMHDVTRLEQFQVQPIECVNEHKCKYYKIWRHFRTLPRLRRMYISVVCKWRKQ